MPSIARSLLLLCLLGLQGCDLPYYWQAARGQIDLLQRRQDITHLLAADTTDPVLKSQLDYVLTVRAFAQKDLHLEPGDNYLSYADLQRPYVVWNVFATPELSLQNQHWCFPIAGCVPYRGYFSETDARAFADTLAQQGFDTYVGGVTAYSTLGWFDDAVLNTFITRDKLSLAALLIHELAHRTLYVADDSVFNESFATAVENIGLQRWVEQTGLQALTAQHSVIQQRQQKFLTLVLANRKQREALFGAALSDAEKRAGKRELQHQLSQQYAQLKHSWDGYNGYDGWFSQSVNNAQLSTVATYFELEPGFVALFDQTGGNFSLFFQQCRELAEKPLAERHNFLNRLAAHEIVYTEK